MKAILFAVVLSSITANIAEGLAFPQRASLVNAAAGKSVQEPMSTEWPHSGKYVDMNRCLCPKSNFYKRYFASFTVLKVKVLRILEVCGPPHRTRRSPFQLLEYLVYVNAVFKGPKWRTSNLIRVRAFTSGDLCGLRLRRNEMYLLSFDDPRRYSKAGSIPRGTFALTRCQLPQQWYSLSFEKLKFLHHHD